MKRNYSRLLLIACLVVAIIGLMPLLYQSLWTVLAIGSGPKMINDIHKTYEKASTEKLIDMIKTFKNPYSFYYYSPYPSIALEVLAERKERLAVPVLINLLEIRDSNRKKAVIRALGIIGDPAAIEPLVRLVNAGSIDYNPNNLNTPYNIEALEALARMKYDGIYNQAVEIATHKNDPNDFRSYGITMLEYLGKPESIPILEQIATSDSKPYIRDKAKMAIEHIEFQKK